jgi:8-oxo-dGTP pyrophosphatase MutT (NUDIX family)
MNREHERFVIGQKAVFIRDGKCLIGEIPNRPGLWELPGGRLEKSEYRETAFRREIKEELGLDKIEIIGPVDYEIWYNDDGTPFCAIANLIRNDADPVTMSEEHSRFAWISLVKKKFRIINFIGQHHPGLSKKVLNLMNC